MTSKKMQYKKAATFFSKCIDDCLVIQHTDNEFGNNYFITEGHVALMLPETVYKEFFHDARPQVYPIIPGGEIRHNGVICGGGYGVEKYFHNNPGDNNSATKNKCERTDFCKDYYDDFGRPCTIRYFIADNGNAIATNDKFVKAFDFFDDYMSDGSPIHPVWGIDYEHGVFGLILPIRTGNPEYVGKALKNLAAAAA